MVEILDGEAVVGAAMAAGEEALDDLSGDEFHVADASKPLRIEITLAHGFTFPSARGRSGTASRRCGRN